VDEYKVPPVIAFKNITIVKISELPEHCGHGFQFGVKTDVSHPKGFPSERIGWTESNIFLEKFKLEFNNEIKLTTSPRKSVPL
jgi:hypothetical protein